MNDDLFIRSIKIGDTLWDKEYEQMGTVDMILDYNNFPIVIKLANGLLVTRTWHGQNEKGIQVISWKK